MSIVNHEQNPGDHRSDLIGRFAQHKVAANLLMLIMLLAGAVSLIKLNTQFLPNFEPDYVIVRVTWPGASAEDVAKSIVTPLEQQLRNLDYVKEMRSTSYQSAGVIVLEYDEGSDMGLALDQVKEYVDLVRNLPSDSETPEVSKVSLNEDVATIILSSDGTLEELRPLAYQYERELLDRGVAKVEFIGLPSQEIAIQVDSKQISALKMSLPQLGQQILNASQDIPAGTSGKSEAAKELRSIEQRRSESGFEQLAILSGSSAEPIKLEDIAVVQQRNKDNQIEVFYQNRPAVLLRVLRTQSSDTLKAAETLNNWLADTKPLLPQTVQLHAYNEAYVLIEDRINLLIKNGLGGLILVVSILFIFLNGRVAFWVAVGIPISFMGTLAILYLVGGSINMVSMFALIMALGIIVDDAIVVGEDALTHYSKGENPLRAAEGGARRMFVPVLSSSLTTVSAFLPLMLISGIIGNILFDIPLVIICVIIASVIECFLVLPGHLNHSFKRSFKANAAGSYREKIDQGFNRFRDNFFRPLSEKSIENRGVILCLSVAILAVSITLIASGRVKSDFFPQPESHILLGNVKFASGTPPEKVREFGLNMEQALQQADAKFAKEQRMGDADSLVVHSVLRINQASFDGGQNYSTGEQYASVHVELLTPDARDIRNPEFIEAWNDFIDQPDGVEQLSISSPRGGPPGKDVDIFLTGQATSVLKQAGEDLATKLKTYVGVRDIQDDLPFGKNQFIYSLTPLGEALGFTVSDVGRQLRAAFDGQLLQVFYDENEEIEVRIILPDEERNYSRILDNFPLVTPSGDIAQLSNVVTLTHRKGLELVRHTEGKLGLHVTASVNPDLNNANQIIAELQEEFLPNLSIEYGIKIDLKGRAEEQAQTGKDMMLGAAIGFTLIYIILAWVFGSYSWPVAVLLAIPLGISGAILGHWLLGIDLTMLSWFGFFGLSGIVINDAIILVTFYRELREQGQPAKQAIVDASCLRLRAVMLTSLTTVAGLLPLLFETSLQAQFLIPMAVSISFGLAYATILILFVIPALISLIEEFKERKAKA
ncbi:efflux RND transporter permease subunit [Oleiphilus sp. HI0086]|nr:efflux RND transporter permease subunit [Oleiphilus sp. HI0086]KZZ31097.1 acriflavin resistance protein [Oleiphilus sp. HI0086]